MFSSIQIILIILVVVLFLFFNTKKGNTILEKNILLKSLLFAVNLFIETEEKQESKIKKKIKSFFAKFILALDMWFLNSRSNGRRKQEVYIKEKKDRE